MIFWVKVNILFGKYEQLYMIDGIYILKRFQQNTNAMVIKAK